MAEHGTRDVPGGLVWKFDPLHQTSGAGPVLTAPQSMALLARDQVPGSATSKAATARCGSTPTDEAERLAAMRAEHGGRARTPATIRTSSAPSVSPTSLLDFLGGLPCAD